MRARAAQGLKLNMWIRLNEAAEAKEVGKMAGRKPREKAKKDENELKVTEQNGQEHCC